MAEIDDIIAAEQKRLEHVLRAAYDAGRKAAKQELLAVLSSDTPTPSHVSADDGGAIKSRQRAPKGLPRKLVSRVLHENHFLGSTPQNIVDAAVTEDEKMIAVSTIRSELRKGKDEGRYVERDGLWSLSRRGIRGD